MDVVVCVDTSVAHLSGALGKETWVLLPFSPDWRWFAERGDSPWYPSARLFRQSKPGDWPSAIDAVRGALHERLAAGAPAPSPAGEPPMLDRRYFAAVELINAGRDEEATAALQAILNEDSGHAAALRRMAWLCHKRRYDALTNRREVMSVWSARWPETNLELPPADCSSRAVASSTRDEETQDLPTAVSKVSTVRREIT